MKIRLAVDNKDYDRLRAEFEALGIEVNDDAEYILRSEGIPKCECGGMIKPDVVLYEEGLDDATMSEAVHHIVKADLLIIGGTSLVVYPAAGMIRYFRGKHLVLLNKSATSADEHATLCIRDSIGQVLKQIEVK